MLPGFRILLKITLELIIISKLFQAELLVSFCLIFLLEIFLIIAFVGDESSGGYRNNGLTQFMPGDLLGICSDF